MVKNPEKKTKAEAWAEESERLRSLSHKFLRTRPRLELPALEVVVCDNGQICIGHEYMDIEDFKQLCLWGLREVCAPAGSTYVPPEKEILRLKCAAHQTEALLSETHKSLKEARDEVKEQQREIQRLESALKNATGKPIPYIRLERLRRRCGMIEFRIAEQTREFVCFNATNGIVIQSQANPEWRNPILCCRGTDNSCDLQIIKAPLSDWPRIQAAVKEFNEYHEKEASK